MSWMRREAERLSAPTHGPTYVRPPESKMPKSKPKRVVSATAPARRRGGSGVDPVLDQIARAQAGQSFKSLPPEQKELIKSIAARMQNPIHIPGRPPLRSTAKTALSLYDKGVKTAYDWTAGLPSRLGHSLLSNPSPEELASSYEEHLGLTTSQEFQQASPEEQAAMMTGMDMSEHQGHGAGCGCPQHNPRRAAASGRYLPPGTKVVINDSSSINVSATVVKWGQTVHPLYKTPETALVRIDRSGNLREVPLWAIHPAEGDFPKGSKYSPNPSKPMALTVGKQMSLTPPHPADNYQLQGPWKFIPKYTSVKIQERGRGGHRFLVHGEYYSSPFWGWVDKEDLQPYEPEDRLENPQYQTVAEAKRDFYRMGFENGKKERGQETPILGPERVSGQADHMATILVEHHGMPASKKGEIAGEFVRGYFDAYHGGRRGRRRNPESGADSMFESFHGYPPEQDTIIEEEEHFHENLASLGDLRSMEILTPTHLKVEIGFEPQKGVGMPLLCSNEDGTQLFIEGGDQEIDLHGLKMDGKKWIKEKMVLGDIETITYDTEKTFDNREPVSYYHHFTEDEPGQPLPELVYDTVNKKLFIVGGKYFIKQPLIGVSPGIEN